MPKDGLKFRQQADSRHAEGNARITPDQRSVQGESRTSRLSLDTALFLDSIVRFYSSHVVAWQLEAGRQAHAGTRVWRRAMTGSASAIRRLIGFTRSCGPIVAACSYLINVPA
ncbi:hypothetical protein KCV07_g336, partial [Aureobasidium melanogenum]